MAGARLPKPVREHPFALERGRKWAFDYAWPEYMIAFEVEGGVFGRMIVCGPGTFEVRKAERGGNRPLPAGTRLRLGGRHNDPAGMQRDCEKYTWAAILGWVVVRATTTMIRDGLAITLLEAAFKERLGVIPVAVTP